MVFELNNNIRSAKDSIGLTAGYGDIGGEERRTCPRSKINTGKLSRKVGEHGK